jgi:TolB protein
LFTHDISGYQSSDYRQLNTHIFIYNFAAAISTDMSLYKEDGTNDLDPRYAPNEAKIIFVNTSNDGVSVKQVWMMDMDGDNRDLLFDNAYMPDWE